VKDAVGSLEGFPQEIRVDDTSFNKLNLQAGEIFYLSRGEIIDNYYLILLCQRRGQIGAYEACSPGYYILLLHNDRTLDENIQTIFFKLSGEMVKLVETAYSGQRSISRKAFTSMMSCRFTDRDDSFGISPTHIITIVLNKLCQIDNRNKLSRFQEYE